MATKREQKPLAIERRKTLQEEAVHKELATELGCEYLPGSLWQIEMIRDWFKGTDPVTVYIFDDEAAPEQGREFIEGEDVTVFRESSSGRFFVQKSLISEVAGSGLPGMQSPQKRKFRNLTAFVSEQRTRIMAGLVQGLDRELMRRWCYRKMHWNGRPIEDVYFNTEDRAVYLQLSKPV